MTRAPSLGTSGSIIATPANPVSSQGAAGGSAHIHRGFNAPRAVNADSTPVARAGVLPPRVSELKQLASFRPPQSSPLVTSAARQAEHGSGGDAARCGGSGDGGDVVYMGAGGGSVGRHNGGAGSGGGGLDAAGGDAAVPKFGSVAPRKLGQQLLSEMFARSAGAETSSTMPGKLGGGPAAAPAAGVQTQGRLKMPAARAVGLARSSRGGATARPLHKH